MVAWLHEATHNQIALENLKKIIIEVKEVSEDGVLDPGEKESLNNILEQIKLTDKEFEKTTFYKKVYDELSKLSTENSANVNLNELNKRINDLSKIVVLF